jgi:hypothetical protein
VAPDAGAPVEVPVEAPVEVDVEVLGAVEVGVL